MRIRGKNLEDDDVSKVTMKDVLTRRHNINGLLTRQSNIRCNPRERE